MVIFSHPWNKPVCRFCKKRSGFYVPLRFKLPSKFKIPSWAEPLNFRRRSILSPYEPLVWCCRPWFPCCTVYAHQAGFESLVQRRRYQPWKRLSWCWFYYKFSDLRHRTVSNWKSSAIFELIKVADPRRTKIEANGRRQLRIAEFTPASPRDAVDFVIK